MASRAASVSDWIETHIGSKVTKGGGVGGGSGWSSATIYTVEDGRQFFVKTARGMEALPMFTGEALGLQAMYGERNSCAFFGSASQVLHSSQRQASRLLSVLPARTCGAPE